MCSLVIKGYGMILAIDGFNAIYKFPDLEEKMYRGEIEGACRGLLELLFALKKKWKKPLEIHVFFDGKKKKGDLTTREKAGDLHVYYSLDMSADYHIKEFIKSRHSPGEIRVVSSDKDVAYFAKKAKCHSQSSEEFAVWVDEVLHEKKLKEIEVKPDMKSGDLDFWKKMFSRSPGSDKR